ncbi:hypothetical protein PC120_g25516 [Phytophthora cactorum]|nr:hypothetical protein PC120_g25516 [Phytophthora cactorum]
MPNVTKSKMPEIRSGVPDKGVDVLEARLGLSGGSSARGAETGVKTT